MADTKRRHALGQREEGWMPSLVARYHALARLFSNDAALAVGHHLGASADELSRAKWTTLVQELYSAKHTALCVVGDAADTEDVVAAAQKLSLKTKSAERLGAAVRPTPAPNTVHLVDMETYQAHLAVAGVGPVPTHADFAAMWLLDQLMGGMFTSVTNRELRERRSLTYRAHSYLMTSQALGAWLFQAAIDGDRVSEALDAISEQFRRLRWEISEDDFLRARATAVAALEARSESTGDLLGWLVWSFHHGLEATAMSSFVERVRGVSREDVERVAFKYLPEHLGPIVIVGRATYIRGQLQWSDYHVP